MATLAAMDGNTRCYSVENPSKVLQSEPRNIKSPKSDRPEDGVKIPTFEIHAQAIDFIKVKGRAESDDTATEGEANGAELASPEDDDIPF